MTMDIRGTNKPQTPVMFKLISFIFSLISVSYVPLILEFSWLFCTYWTVLIENKTSNFISLIRNTVWFVVGVF